MRSSLLLFVALFVSACATASSAVRESTVAASPPSAESSSTTSDGASVPDEPAPSAAPADAAASAPPSNQAPASRASDTNESVAIEDDETVGSTDDFEQLRRTQTALQRCYLTARMLDANTATRVTASFAIGDHDSLVDVEVHGSTPEVHECVRGVLETMSHRHGLASGSHRYSTTLTFAR
jgi:hypothetical protein